MKYISVFTKNDNILKKTKQTKILILLYLNIFSINGTTINIEANEYKNQYGGIGLLNIFKIPFKYLNIELNSKKLLFKLIYN